MMPGEYLACFSRNRHTGVISLPYCWSWNSVRLPFPNAVAVNVYQLIMHSGLMTAAQLKALGVESIVVDRNPHIGDNWAQRYDTLRFHVPTSSC